MFDVDDHCNAKEIGLPFAQRRKGMEETALLLLLLLLVLLFIAVKSRGNTRGP